MINLIYYFVNKFDKFISMFYKHPTVTHTHESSKSYSSVSEVISKFKGQSR